MPVERQRGFPARGLSGSSRFLERQLLKAVCFKQYAIGELLMFPLGTPGQDFPVLFRPSLLLGVTILSPAGIEMEDSLVSRSSR